MKNEIFTPTEVTSTIAYDSVPSTMRGKTINVRDMYPTTYKRFISDAKIHDANFAFLTTTLAKLYTKLVEPKYFVTYTKDLKDCIDYGGGFVDYVQYYSVNWAGIANQFRNVVGNGANYIPRVNAGMSQMTANVYTFELAYDIRFIELEKMKKLQLQKSLESIYNDAIVAAWDFFVQRIVYLGGETGHYGLFNHTDIVPTHLTTISKASVQAGTTDATALAGLINGIIEKSFTNSNMNLAVVPNVFLVPTWFGSALTSKTNELFTNSLRSYIIEHNLATDESSGEIKITIESRPDLDTLGTNGVGRIVAYRREKDFVRLDMPYPMKHYITLPNIERMAYTTAFVGQVSEIQLPYCTSNTDEASPVSYWDFVA